MKCFVPSLLLTLLLPAISHAQPVPDYGLQWATIGSPGNRAPNAQEYNDFSPLPSGPPGSVPYEYRISKTEITNTQWFEFVQAYTPHFPALARDPNYLANDIFPTTTGGYGIAPGRANWPATFCWRAAAMYCNWLHNGRANTRAAFESGAYDISTFITINNGNTTSYLDQLTRSPGARFWIPSFDEWIKATFFDPNRYGTGQAGYWQYTYGMNEPPVTGLPGMGGQTNRGLEGPDSAFNVGTYPNMSAPWGLLDVSGGALEWTETVSDSSGRRLTRVSAGGPLSPFFDHITAWSDKSPEIGFQTLRLAGIVPTPTTALSLGIAACGLLATRRRRTSVTRDTAHR